MFSPITERSPKIKLLYLVTYGLLLLGGLTMILPFLIMITGSLEPSASQASKVMLFPRYLISDDALWNRYVRAKYGDTAEKVRVAWNDDRVDLDQTRREPVSEKALAQWRAFLSETRPEPRFFALAFAQGSRMPSFSGRQFRRWLLKYYGNDLDRLNSELKTSYPKTTSVNPPLTSVLGASLPESGMIRKYLEFIAENPALTIPNDAGNAYRIGFLPKRMGSITAYNAKYGTQHTSWETIPFEPELTGEGAEEWLFFVKQMLRPDFVEFTEKGAARFAASGVSKDEFIRAVAEGNDLRVRSIDTMFAAWSAERGYPRAVIPQRSIDETDFAANKGFWRWQLPLLNYQRVLDEILLHGHAFLNTIILVVLFVVGSLTVNPLAAYALSRFKLKQTYFILVFCIATIAFPAEVTMIPVFLQLKEFGMLNTFGALVIPSLANGFSIFLLKGFFDSLPKELYEAAELDGAREPTMFWIVTMNLSKPILAVMALAAFTTAYGTFFYALILAPDPRMWTIMVYIFQLQSTVDAPVVYASLILVSIPTLLVFILCQNVILRGIVVPSEK